MRKLLFVTGLVIIGMIAASTPVWAQGLPAISIEKLVNGHDAGTPPGPSIAVGSAVLWSYIIANIGNVALTNVTVTDDQGVVVTCPKFSLEPGEAMVCTAMGTAVPGQYVNIGAAAGMAPTGEWVSDTDPAYYLGVQSAITIKKFVNGYDADTPPGPSILVGDPVLWSYIIANIGNVALTNVAVTDDQGVVVTCPKFSLEPGESMTCTAMGTAVAGQYANTGTTEGMAPTGEWVNASDPAHYFGVQPGIHIKKLVNGHDADTPPGPEILVGSTVLWTYDVANTGNEPLISVAVTDDQGVPVACPKSSLEPQESMVCTASGTAVAGQYANIGTATGKDSGENLVSASDPCHYYGVLGPGPSGIGAADPSMVEAGEPAFLTVTVTPGANPPSTGLAVVCDLSSIGGSNAQTFYDDGASGDATAGDNIFSFTAMVPDTTPDGEKHLPCAISEAEGRPGSASIALITYHDFSDCYMTGGGKLWGPYAPPLPPGKTVFVDYGFLLSCPEVIGTMNDFAGPAPLHPELKMLTVAWGSSNRFTLKSPVKIECGTELPPYLTFISGTGFGTWNWMPGYFISFKFVDNLLTGTRDVASIVISEASNAHRIILHATDARIVTGGHAIHCPIVRTMRR